MEDAPKIKGSEKILTYPFDAVVILCANIIKIADKYQPTDYRHSDLAGILGGGIRVTAALELWKGEQSSTFVFSSGVDKAEERQNVPLQSTIYKEKFMRLVEWFRRNKSEGKNLKEPVVYEEARSVSTMTNLQEIAKLAEEKGWGKIAIVSSDYHVPRVRGLWGERNSNIEVEFIGAESYLKETAPGKYDDLICQWTSYENSEMLKRVSNEAKGLIAIQKGKYK